MALESLASERMRIQENLKRGLGPEYVSSRPVGGGGNAPYLEGSKAFNLANEIFGFDGWSSTVKQFQVDYCDVDSRKRVDLGIYVIVQVVLKDGTWREDVGFGHAENARNKAAAYEKARKEAVTDGIKRALRQFGNALGNCLYDNKFTRQLSKVKFQEQPLSEDDLYRSGKVVGVEPTAPRGIPPQHRETMPQLEDLPRENTNTNHRNTKPASIPVTVKGEAQKPYARAPNTTFSSTTPNGPTGFITKAAEFDVTESMLMSSPRQDPASDFSDIDEGDIEICLQQSGENDPPAAETPVLNPINESNRDELLAFVPGSQADSIKQLKPTMKFDTKVLTSSVAKSLPDKSCPIKRPVTRNSPVVTPTASKIQDRFPRDVTPLAHKAPATPMDSPRPGFVKPANPPCTPLVSLKKRPLTEKSESVLNAESKDDESRQEKVPTPEMKKTKIDAN